MKKPVGEIERSLIKSYRKELWVRFTRAAKNYQLVEEGDKIAVAISGGKDSLTLAKLFQELQRHGQQSFDLEFICMDPGYRPEVKEQVEGTCQGLGIPVKVHNSDVFKMAEKTTDGNAPCYMCTRMRRSNPYNQAQELGCNKLILGHHFSDVIETILMNVFCNANLKTMVPKLKSQNFQGLELIRPIYLIHEEDIIRFMRSMGYEAIDCACTVTQKEDSSTRFKIKQMIGDMKEGDKNVEISIFRSAENVNQDAIIDWVENGEKKSFLDKYDS